MAWRSEVGGWRRCCSYASVPLGAGRCFVAGRPPLLRTLEVAFVAAVVPERLDAIQGKGKPCNPPVHVHIRRLSWRGERSEFLGLACFSFYSQMPGALIVRVATKLTVTPRTTQRHFLHVCCISVYRDKTVSAEHIWQSSLRLAPMAES